MATFADLLPSSQKEMLDKKVADDFKAEQEARYNRRKKFYDKYGFHSYEEMLDYIKTNGHIGNYGSEYFWCADEYPETPIRHHYQTSDGNDCVFWMTNSYKTEQEFLDYYNGLIEKYGSEYHLNEFGCLEHWHKDVDSFEDSLMY